jgi:hypothetical protein
MWNVMMRIVRCVLRTPMREYRLVAVENLLECPDSEPWRNNLLMLCRPRRFTRCGYSTLDLIFAYYLKQCGERKYLDPDFSRKTLSGTG